MLQAKNRKGELVTLLSFTTAEIEQLRQRERFFCPECNELVIVRAGPRVIPHFAHYRTSNCALSLKGESAYHQKAKQILYQWLKEQLIDVKLEKFLPDINQRPDLFFSYKKRTFAIEFQSSLTDQMTILKRNEGYLKKQIIPIWLLGKPLLKRTSNDTIQVNDWTLLFVQQFSSKLPTTLYYFSPIERMLTTVTDLHLINRRKAIATMTEQNLFHLSFPKIFSTKKITRKILFTRWQKEKRKFRLAAYHVYGKELKWRKWLYHKRLYIDNLPSVIHLPIPTQHYFKVPPWNWQSRFIIEFLHPLSVGRSFSLKEIQHFLRPYLYRNEFPLLPHDDFPFIPYLHLLSEVNYIKRVDDNTYMKSREIKFYDHIEKAIDGDDALLRYFMYNRT